MARRLAACRQDAPGRLSGGTVQCAQPQWSLRFDGHRRDGSGVAPSPAPAGISLNRTHRKVLAFALRGERHTDDDPKAAIEWLAGRAESDLTYIQTGHELDAVISAWATGEGLSEGWVVLVTDSAALLFPAGNANYLWPKLPELDLSTTEAPAFKSSTAGKVRASRLTTAIGYVNGHQQELVRRTDALGNDHGQRV
jgi:hypothetical protein